jgi:hypothetical protein
MGPRDVRVPRETPLRAGVATPSASVALRDACTTGHAFSELSLEAPDCASTCPVNEAWIPDRDPLPQVCVDELADDVVTLSDSVTQAPGLRLPTARFPAMKYLDLSPKRPV